LKGWHNKHGCTRRKPHSGRNQSEKASQEKTLAFFEIHTRAWCAIFQSLGLIVKLAIFFNCDFSIETVG